MNLDFTLNKYKELCQAIKLSKYEALTVRKYLSHGGDTFIILRHDVDRAVGRALKMAQVEHEYDIASTYYFRHTNDVFYPDIIHKIQDLGHEIGYHYEVIDKAKGDAKKAIWIFKQELEDLRTVGDVKTACMHGNPLSPWSNRDLWEIYDFKDFGIIGEPYISIDYNKVMYLTDTGRTWADQKIRVKDVVKTRGYEVNNNQSVRKIKSTDDIIELIQTERVPQICLVAHPNRWCDNLIGWGQELLLQNIKNIGKAGIVWYRNRNQKNTNYDRNY